MDIYTLAINKLQYRDRTKREIYAHLYSYHKFTEDEIINVIKRLEDSGYINDYTYCQKYFNYALGKGKGKKVFFYELAQKGVDKEIIQNAYTAYEEENTVDEFDVAMNIAIKTVQGKDIDEKAVGKVARKLSRLGHSSNTIYTVISKLKEIDIE